MPCKREDYCKQYLYYDAPCASCLEKDSDTKEDSLIKECELGYKYPYTENDCETW